MGLRTRGVIVAEYAWLSSLRETDLEISRGWAIGFHESLVGENDEGPVKWQE